MDPISLSDSSDEEINFFPVPKPAVKDDSDEVVFCGVIRATNPYRNTRISSLDRREVTIQSVRKRNTASKSSDGEVQFLSEGRKSKDDLKTVSLVPNSTDGADRLASNLHININSQKSLNTNLTINIEDDSEREKKKVQLTFLGASDRGKSSPALASRSTNSKFNPLISSTPKIQYQNHSVLGNLNTMRKAIVSSNVNNLNISSGGRFNFGSSELVGTSFTDKGSIVIANHSGPPVKLQKSNVPKVSTNSPGPIDLSTNRVRGHEMPMPLTVLHNSNNNRFVPKQNCLQTSVQEKINNELNVKSKDTVVNTTKKDNAPHKTKTAFCNPYLKKNSGTSNSVSRTVDRKFVQPSCTDLERMKSQDQVNINVKESRLKSPQPSSSGKSRHNSPQPSCSKTVEKSNRSSSERCRNKTVEKSNKESENTVESNVKSRKVKKTQENDQDKSSVASTSRSVFDDTSSDSSDQESDGTTSESSSSDELDDAKPLMKKPQLDKLFEKFLQNCSNTSAKTEVLKFKIKLNRHYLNTKDAVNNNDFILCLKESNVALETRPVRCPLGLMKKVLTYLRRDSPETLRKIKKLESVLREINEKIKHLGEAEVTSDEDECDNSYVKLGRYRDKAVQIYNKICELSSTPADADRPTNRNVSFLGTIPEQFSKSTSIQNLVNKVSHALEKYYNKSRKFPDFSDVKKLITKLSIELSIKIKQESLHQLARNLFIDFGTMLQRRRLHDDYQICTEYLDSDADDPYFYDPVLASKLDANRKLRRKEQDILDKYCMKEVDLYVSDKDGSDTQSSICSDSNKRRCKKRKSYQSSDSDDCANKNSKRNKSDKGRAKDGDSDSTDEDNVESKRVKRKRHDKSSSSSSSDNDDDNSKEHNPAVSESKRSKMHISDDCSESESHDHLNVRTACSSLDQPSLTGYPSSASTVPNILSKPVIVCDSENESSVNSKFDSETTAIITSVGAVIDLSNDSDNENLYADNGTPHADSEQNVIDCETSNGAVEIESLSYRKGTEIEKEENREQVESEINEIEENLECVVVDKYMLDCNPETDDPTKSGEGGNVTDERLLNDETSRPDIAVEQLQNEEENRESGNIDASQNRGNEIAQELSIEEENREIDMADVSRSEEGNQENEVDVLRNGQENDEHNLFGVSRNEGGNYIIDLLQNEVDNQDIVVQNEEENQENDMTRNGEGNTEKGEAKDQEDKLVIDEELDNIQITSVTTCSQTFSESQGSEATSTSANSQKTISKKNPERLSTIVLSDDDDQDCVIVQTKRNILTNDEISELIPIIMTATKGEN